MIGVGTALSFLKGGGGKLLLYGGLALAAFLAWNHYQGVVADRDHLATQFQLSEAAHSQTTKSFTQFVTDSNAQAQRLQESLNEMTGRFQAAEEKADDLRNVLQRHDLGRLAKAKPGLIARRVNGATERLWLRVSELTGKGIDDDKPANGEGDLSAAGTGTKASD